MRIRFGELIRWQGTIDRGPYVLLGLALVAVKYGLDWFLASQVFGRSWSPINYLALPSEVADIMKLPESDRSFYLTLLVLALPFIWAGVALTVHRLRATGLPLGLVVLFFVPVANVTFFLLLCLLPSQNLEADSSPPQQPPDPRMRRLSQAHRRVTREDPSGSAVVALFVSVPLTLAMAFLSANVLANYGWGLFVGLPFFLGFSSVALFGFSRPQRFGPCMAVAGLAAGLTGVGLLAVAFEGIICLIMAAPILLPLIFLGAAFGYTLQARPWQWEGHPYLLFALLLTLPGLMAAESASGRESELLEVCSTVDICAHPEVVWQNVIAFPALPEPDTWVFRTGIAYPQRAEIQGRGVGAVRRCVFSTGAFVEPIEVWDEPRLLRFRVQEQPEPMREWSPYNIHPPHLDHYLVSRRGEFMLEPLPDGGTRLCGTTWYTNRMWPARYWQLWSDAIIHRIHLRVLEHIQRLAESGR